MKFLMVTILALTTALSFADHHLESFKIDPTATSIEWVGKKVLGQHDGKISVKEGHLTMEKDLIKGGEILVDMNTITVSDIPATDEYNAKLVGHLKSPDFFHVEKYPTSKLVIKSSEKTKKGLKIKGDLTFNGKTNPVEFETTLNKSANQLTGQADLVLDRTKWDLKYGSSSFIKGLGDKAINNDFTLSIKLSAKK